MSVLKYWNGTSWIEANGNTITGDTVPIGAQMFYPSTTAPTGWLICDGSAISRTDYAELFAIIGTSFGAGDGTTTFNLPNWKGRVPVGYDSSDNSFNSIGKTGGEKTHTLTINEMPSHNHGGTTGTDQDYNSAFGVSYLHNVNYFNQGIGQSTQATPYATASIDGFSHKHSISNQGGGQAHNNLQPYLVPGTVIIKAFQSVGVVANVSNIYSTSETDTYSCDYINNCNTYSTSETFTGKYWWDNNPIYRKVIYMAQPSNSEDIATGINPANIIWYDAIVSTGGGYINKINSTEWDTNYRITGDIDPSGYFRFRAGSSQSSIENLNVIIEYTK